MRASVKVDFPYLVADTDRHGNVRYYYRRKGKPKVRLPGEPGSSQFLEQYELAHAGKITTKLKRIAAGAGSLRWLCQEYFKSVEFRLLHKRTQHVRRLVLEGICRSKTPSGKERGDGLVAYMLEKQVKEIRDERADRPGSANNTVKALRPMFTWAKEKGHVSINPAQDVRQLRGGKGWHVWTEDEVALFEAKHPIGTKARLAFALIRYTGVRRSDVVKLGPTMARDGVLRFVATKGAERRGEEPSRLVLPILPELQTVIDASETGKATYLVTEFGEPFSVAGFGNKMREWCDEAGLPHCTAHGIRKHGATTAAENGATTHQLMAMFGWDSVKQAEIYTRKANKTRLAKAAMHLLSASTENEKSAEVSHLQKVGHSTSKKAK